MSYRYLITIILAIAIGASSYGNRFARLQTQLEEYVESKDANIGIAVIVDGKDTVSVNGKEPFPMLSVYKLPIALALGDYLLTGSKMIADTITITRGELKTDTYSPMREKYGPVDSLRLPLMEILAYALQLSDNNASDVMLRLLPSRGYVNHFLQREGFRDITVVSTEDEMHQNPQLCYSNSATPLAMASLLWWFDKEKCDRFSLQIKQLLETCQTGTERLAKPFAGRAVQIGHKTGTGFELPDGRLMAVNDVGYVHLPSGRAYTIAVFIANSRYDMSQTEAIIAEISRMVCRAIDDKLISYAME